MKLPIGVSSFRELIEVKSPASGEGYLYVDKSLFISEIVDDLTKVIVITRPRRFGKTLNLSMLQYFFAAEVDSKPTAGLFDGLAISKQPECMQLQGKYPVIFISFKGVKEINYKDVIENFAEKIEKLYTKFQYLLTSTQLYENEKRTFEEYLYATSRCSTVKLKYAIASLAQFITKHHKISPYILIDEYDTPLHEAYEHKYYDTLILFMREFLGSALKDNSSVKQSILTGVLRVSKESLFSDLNNVKIHSILSNKYSEYFGFTENEVNDLLNRANTNKALKETKAWYNGYNFGGTTIYNPWSIIEFIEEKGRLRSYWVNTSGNNIVKDLIMKASPNIQEKIQALIAGHTIKEYVDEHIVFNDLNKSPAAIWSLLLMSGYLKYASSEDKGSRYLCELLIPNKEVEYYYATIIEEWLSGDRGIEWYKDFLNDLADGKVAAFEQKLQTFITETLSCHDVTNKTQESFYHGLMLAFVCGLKETHIVKSNKESGLGFYDVVIIPKDRNKLGIVMEFKAPQKKGKQAINLEKEAKLALAQINKSKYITELQQLDVTNICKMGIAFAKKAVKIAWQ